MAVINVPECTFGLKNAQLFSLLWITSYPAFKMKHETVHLDGIIIFTISLHEHVKSLTEVLSRLKESVKGSKDPRSKKIPLVALHEFSY